MPRSNKITLTPKSTLGLFFIQRYRFLTIEQFARAGEINKPTGVTSRARWWEEVVGSAVQFERTWVG